MDYRNVTLAVLIGAAASVIFANVPILNLTNCLLCAPFWASAILAVWIYRRQTGSLTMARAVVIGIGVGLVAGVVGFLLSFIGWAGGAALINSYKSFLPADSGVQIPAEAPDILINLCGVLIEIVFGAVGGLIGGAVFRTNR
jgi:hypothetical protein